MCLRIQPGDSVPNCARRTGNASIGTPAVESPSLPGQLVGLRGLRSHTGTPRKQCCKALLTGLPCSRLSRENTLVLTRALRGAQDLIRQIFAARRKASQPWPLPLQDQTSICCLRPCRPSQVMEFVFAANPETTRSEPQELPSPSPVAAGLGSLLAVDLCDSLLQ